jgi:hypothetical protein
VENISELLQTGGRGLNETYNVLLLFHELQSLYDAIIQDVVPLLAAA